MPTLALAALPPCALIAVAVAQGLLVSSARAAACPATGLSSDHAEPETVDALAAALAGRDLAGAGSTWVGKLGSVGHGRRDTIIFVPAALDRSRPIELVVFMDGYGSFAERTMDARHAAAIQAIRDGGVNAVYVAPDAPSSVFGDPRSGGAYWRSGCEDRRCAGGHAAPGDFIAFTRDVIAHVDRVTCAGPDTQFRLALIGFSAGGRGVHDAVAQLADHAIAGVTLTRVVFADAVYGSWWFGETWSRVRDRPELEEVTVLLQAGGFGHDDVAPGHGNRARIWDVARTQLGAGAPPESAADIVLGRVRIRRMALDHPGIGDHAHEVVVPVAAGAL